jgi:hypothetical protein
VLIIVWFLETEIKVSSALIVSFAWAFEPQKHKAIKKIITKLHDFIFLSKLGKLVTVIKTAINQIKP